MTDAQRIEAYQKLARGVLNRWSSGGEEYDTARAVLELAKMVEDAKPPATCPNAREQIDAVLRLLEVDPHQFSTRPCPTCQPISALAGRDFGCVEMAKTGRRPGR